MTDFDYTDLNALIKETGNQYASIAEDGIEAGDVAGWISTGSLSFNALLSGSIYGGIPSNKVVALAGEPSTGKTFFALNIVHSFLQTDPTAFVLYFESESAISKQMMESRGIDVKRVGVIPVETVQQFRTQAMKILEKYMTNKERAPMMFVLDSLGNLSTNKEIEDITSGKDTRDMTRAQLIRGAFRALTLKLGKANVPLIVTNHTYAVIGSYFPTRKQGGGDGTVYAASVVVDLSKKKKKDGDEVTGVLITAKTNKSRITKENKKVTCLLNFENGLDPYYGLLDLAVKFGIVKKVSTKLQFPDQTTAFEKTINKNPEKYWTDALLAQIDDACKNEFCYGGTSDLISGDEED